MSRNHACAGLLMLLVACGSSDTADPVLSDSAVAANAEIAAANAAKRSGGGVDASMLQAIDTLAAAGERPLLRESFGYSGSSRDPFRSMITTTVSGPALTDLVLTAVLYDERNARNSVAIFRENGSNRRHTVHPGERIGRLYVSGMTRVTATLRFDDYGNVREQTYSLRPMEDEG
ncbi:MAG: hypothetical protein ABIR59_09130 [Gemmatimonadales bacterium]